MYHVNAEWWISTATLYPGNLGKKSNMSLFKKFQGCTCNTLLVITYCNKDSRCTWKLTFWYMYCHLYIYIVSCSTTSVNRRHCTGRRILGTLFTYPTNRGRNNSFYNVGHAVPYHELNSRKWLFIRNSIERHNLDY